MFGFFKNYHLSDQILVDVLDYLQTQPDEREVFRDAVALSLGITMRMISRWPEVREPLPLVLADIRYRLHPDGAQLLSQQFSNNARKARGSGRKALMYGYGITACWLITSAQLSEKQSDELVQELERYDQFLCKLFLGHEHLLCDESLIELHEKFFVLKPGAPHPKDELKRRADDMRMGS